MTEMKRLGPLITGWSHHVTETSSASEVEAPPERDESLWTPEGEANCEICGGAGYVRVSRPVGDPNFGRVRPCECRRAEEEARAAERLQRLSNLGPMSDARLPEDEAKAGQGRVACEFADSADDEPGWLLMTGPAGSGRTRLSAEMANRRITVGRSALYFVVADLLDRLRSAMNAPSGGDLSYALLFEHVRDAPFLILDDLDCISPTDWAREKLFQLLNHRRNSGRRTVLVSEAADLSAIGLQSFLTLDVERLELGGRASGGRYREFGGMTEELLQKRTFESFATNIPGFPQLEAHLLWAKKEVSEWAVGPAGWLTLYGAPGVGKSHLAAAVVNERLTTGEVVCFAVVSELLDTLRIATNNKHEESFGELFHWLKEVDLLVLDDLAAQKDTEWVTEKLYQLLSYRHLRRLPTLITMNILPDELEPRLASRVMDYYLGKHLHIRGVDYRTKKPSPEVTRTMRGFRRRG